MIGFMKVPPTTYVLHYKNGRIVRQGAGLSFIYYAPTSTIVAIPMASADVPFVFQESTADFQSVTIQGQLTFRVADPTRLASLLDFSVDVRRAYYSDDPRKLPERLINTLQALMRAITERLPLKDALVSSDAIAVEALAKLRHSEAVSALGVEILSLSILGIRPTPETGRALEAEAREALHQRADEAIYARRNAAVEQERLIKESELNTEIAVEEKRRQIRETQMAAEIAVEEQRGQLIDRRVENERKDADSRAYTLTQTIAPLRDLHWKTLMMLLGKNADPKAMISLAFQEMAENAQKLGELNVSPDLLRSLVGASEN
ncbi:MAG TPA: SPFH domain-containing protein [Pyrinomonadaceae bacterium]|nr:SPFH domain-containing protein [Pyrinomonadaceae bacterium]